MTNNEQKRDPIAPGARWHPVRKAMKLLRRFISSFSSSSAETASSTMLADVITVQARLRSIQASVRDAERREVRDGSVRLWLHELQELAYRARDVLDLQQYSQAAERARCRKYISGELEGRIRKRKLGDVDWAAENSSELASLSLPVNDAEIVKAARMFQELFDEVFDMKEKLHLEEDDHDYMEEDGRSNSKTGFIQRFPAGADIVESKIYGRERDLRLLVRVLLSDSKEDGRERSGSSNSPPVSMIALVGMGGVGKTTLAQQAYCHQAIKMRFALKGWVSACHEFQVPDLTRKAMEALRIVHNGSSDLHSIQDALRNRVKDRMFLIVLDDVWNERVDLWEKFLSCFSTGAIGSKILISTRKHDVATAAGAVKPISVGCLSDEDGWSLLREHAFGNSSGYCELHQLEPIGRKIVMKCKGLPLALKVLGSRLRFQIDEDTWEGVWESDLWDIQTYEEGQQILGPLLLSYLDLPSHLKHCFKICSMYPKDHRIDRYELIALWMANDLIVNAKEEENWSYLMETGMGYIDSLMSRSFLQSTGNLEMGMHDLIHDLAQFLSKDACAVIGGDEAPYVHERVRHLWLRPGARTLVKLGKRDSALRTLIIGSRDFLKCTFHFKGSARDVLGGLRMMTLCDDPPIEVLDCLDEMKHLRYLKCYSVELLGSVQRLYNLRVLEMFIGSAVVTELPESIGNLKNLLRLQLTSSAPLYFKRLPESIGELSSLCEFTLWGVQVDEIPESIRGLTNLQKLHLSRCSIRTLPDSIGKLSSLQDIYLSVCTRLHKLPESLGQLSSLQRLTLDRISMSSLPESTGELSNLRELCLRHCNRLQALPLTISGLSKLKKLDMRNCSTIRELPTSIGQLRNLQELLLERCRRLTELPTSIVHLSALCSLGVSPWISLPAGFGRLKKLEFLSECFSVGKSNEQAGISELRDLVRLRGSVSISNLDNVMKLEDCAEANLMNKMYIMNLALKWGSHKESTGKGILEETSAWDEKILEFLKPHSTLIELTIYGWRGVRFPKWLGEQSFSSLVSINLQKCCACNSLYPLSLLPSLKSVSLEGIEDLTEIVQEHDNLIGIGGDNKGGYILDQRCNFPSLEWFYLSDCSSVTVIPLFKLPSLRKMEVFRCDSLVSIDFEGPFLPEHPSLRSKRYSLTELIIEDCARLQSLSCHNYLSSLQNLQISQENEKNYISLQQTHFPNLFKLSFERCEQLRTLSDSISSLKNLEFVGCHALSSIPLYKLNDLKVLSIYSCENLRRIDFESPLLVGRPVAGMHTSLKILYLHDCPRLQFSHSTKLPARLEHLHVINCPSLKEWCILQQNSKESRIVQVNIIDEQRSYFGSELLLNHPSDYDEILGIYDDDT